MNARPAWSSLLIAALLGCTTAPAPRNEVQPAAAPSEEAVQAASDQLLDCYVRTAQQLDDRTSEPRTIGIAVAASCAQEADHFVSVVTRGQPDARRQAFRNAWMQEGKEQATAVVLQLREMPDPGVR